jgi:hypothetical protein
MSRQWSGTFRALGNAVLSLLKAELEAFEKDVARSTRQAALGIGLFVAAGAFAFWTLGVATYFLIQLLALWLPLWGASLVVTGLFAAVAAVLALVGARKLERFENPLGTARRRMDDHIEWWQTRVLVPAPERRVGEGRQAGDVDDDDEDEDETGARS